MIKPVINTASLCALVFKKQKKEKKNFCGQEQKQPATPLSKENIFISPEKKSSHAHSPWSNTLFLFCPSHTPNSDKIESLQSRWAHADKLCDALPSVSKQTNGALRFHKGDYQNVKHLSLPPLVWRRQRHSECRGGGADKGESVDKGERGEIKAERNIGGDDTLAPESNGWDGGRDKKTVAEAQSRFERGWGERKRLIITASLGSTSLALEAWKVDGLADFCNSLLASCGLWPHCWLTFDPWHFLQQSSMDIFCFIFKEKATILWKKIQQSQQTTLICSLTHYWSSGWTFSRCR